MKNNLLIGGLILLLALRLQAEVPDYGMDFVQGAGGAAHAAMGGTGITGADLEFSAFWNPALAGTRIKWQVHLEHGQWFSDELQRDMLYLDLPATHGHGISLWLVSSAVQDIPITGLTDPNAPVSAGNRPFVDHYSNSRQSMIGSAIALYNHPQLRMGVSPHLIYNQLPRLSAWGLGLDAGAYWHRNRWHAGLVIRDLTTTQMFWETGTRETLAPRLEMGIQYRHRLGPLQLTWAGEGRHELGTDNLDLYGNSHVVLFYSGCEIGWADRAALRAGWDNGSVGFGGGLSWKTWQLNYAWKSHPDLGSTHLLSAGLSWY